MNEQLIFRAQAAYRRQCKASGKLPKMEIFNRLMQKQRELVASIKPSKIMWSYNR